MLLERTRITYRQAEGLDEQALRRWLAWAIKGDPSEVRIRETSMADKGQMLAALVWVGAIAW